jgi:hypothetical protein
MPTRNPTFLKKVGFLNPRVVPSWMTIEQLMLESCDRYVRLYQVVGKIAAKVDGERLVQTPTLSRNCDIFER